MSAAPSRATGAIIFAITGLPSDTARAEEAERIVDWAFRQFSEKTVAKAGVRVAEAEVYLGAADTVGLVPAEDVRLLVPALVQDSVTAEVVYNGPLVAPIAAGHAGGRTDRPCPRPARPPRRRWWPKPMSARPAS